MTAKEYLSQARLLTPGSTPKSSRSRLSTIWPPTPRLPYGDAPQPQPLRVPHGGSGGQDRDLQNEINHDIDELVDLKREITRRVKSIPNAEYQLLLEKRYLCFMPWEKIAVDMGYSIQHIYRLHDWALREFPVPPGT